MAARVLAQAALAALGRGDDGFGDPIFLADRGYPDALCNDGSSAAYYFRPGEPSGRAGVFIYLQGGFWCWDRGSCSRRWRYWEDPKNQKKWSGKHLMSSKTLDNVTLNGNIEGGIVAASVFFPRRSVGASHEVVFRLTLPFVKRWEAAHIGRPRAGQRLPRLRRVLRAVLLE